MSVSGAEERHKRKFHMHIIAEEKTYVCAKCGTYSMGASKINFVNDYVAEVLLKCKQCGWEWEREITYFED
jgi:RNase P subunit RPR2